MIRLVYLARLRDALGIAAESVDPPHEVSTVRALVAWLGLVDSMRPVPLPKGIRRYVRYHRRAVKELSDNDARRIYLRRLFFGAIHRKRLRIGIALNRVAARPVFTAGMAFSRIVAVSSG